MPKGSRGQIREQKRRARERRAAIVNDFKRQGCARCDEDDLVVLDCHHVGGKDFELSRAIESYGAERIKAELRKCIVLCANCHRREHAAERERGEVVIEIDRNQLSLVA